MPPIARGRHSLQPYDMWTNHSRNQKHHLHRHHHQLYFQIPFPALLFTSPTPNLVQSCDGLPLVCLHDSSKRHNSLAMVAAKKCLPCLLLNKREKKSIRNIRRNSSRFQTPHNNHGLSWKAGWQVIATAFLKRSFWAVSFQVTHLCWPQTAMNNTSL